jgi:hypothetical protein
MILLLISSIFVYLIAGVPQFGKDIPKTMYINHENNLPIIMNGCSTEDVLVKIISGSLYKKNDSTYAYIPQTEEEELKIKLYYKKVIIEVLTVKTKHLPEGIPVFDKSAGKTISLAAPQSTGQLVLQYSEDVPVYIRPTVTQFNVQAFNPQGANVFNTTVRGNVFDTQTLEKIKQLSPGSKLSVHSIITQHPRLGNARLNATLELQVIP